MIIISHSYVSAILSQSHILRCGLDGTPMFWNSPKPAGRDNVACCACARFPDGALGKIIAAKEHRALAGCTREGAVCICKTINFFTKSFITNEKYEPRNAELYTLCTYVCPYIYLLKFLMNKLFSCCFEITITPGGLRATCGQSHSWCGQLAPRAAGCVIFRPIDWWSWSGIVHRKYTGLPRRIDRIAVYRSSGYNPIFCPVVSAELPSVLIFWNPTDAWT